MATKTAISAIVNLRSVFNTKSECYGKLSKNKCTNIFHHTTAFPLTVERLDAFTTGKGKEHVICLKPAKSPQLTSLVNAARKVAEGMEVKHDKRKFNPHITLGRVPADSITLDDLKAILADIDFPSFSCTLNNVEHFYYEGNKRIESWDLLPQ